MSLIKSSKQVCPNCSKESEITVWDSINVTLDPEMKEKILDFSIFDWTCPHCHSVYHILYGFLYHDMNRKLMIFFEPDESKTFDPLIAKELEQMSFGMDDYTLRAVRGLENFKEKIIIFDAGLNDIIIEFIKASVRVSNKELDNCDIHFLKTVKDQLMFVCHDITTQKNTGFCYPMDAYNHYNEVMSKQDEMTVHSGDFAEVNEEWIYQHISQFNAKHK